MSDARTEARRRLVEAIQPLVETIPDIILAGVVEGFTGRLADAVLDLGQLIEEWRAEGNGWSFPAEGREDAEWQAAHRGAALRAVRVITLRLVVEPVVPEEPQP